MPVFRNHSRRNAGAMFGKRMGGRVSLFNYNPSIAGGKIGVRRFKNAHRMGKILPGNIQKVMTNIQGAEGSGLAAPGMHVGGIMGAVPPTSLHHKASEKKRIFDSISEHLSGAGAKRRR